MSIEDHQALVRRWFEGDNRGEPAAVDELVSPNFIDHAVAFPGQTPSLQNHKGLSACCTTPEADKRVVRWTGRGTHSKGEFKIPAVGRIPPTGKPLSITGISTFCIAGGKLVERGVEADSQASCASWVFRTVRDWAHRRRR